MTLHQCHIANLSVLICLFVNVCFLQINVLNMFGLLALIVIALLSQKISRALALKTKNNTASIEALHDEFVSVLNQIKQTINFEVSVLQTEITRTSEILRDAIPEVANTFKNLESLSHQQQDMLSTLMSESAKHANDGKSTVDTYLTNANIAFDAFLHTIVDTHNKSRQTMNLSDDLTARFDILLSKLEQLDNRQMNTSEANFSEGETVYNEITEAKQVVQQLSASLKSIALIDMVATLTEKEKVAEMINHVSQLNIETEKSLATLSYLSPKIHQAVSDGIRSLQFEDLTFQILGSLTDNINALTALSDEISRFQRTDQPSDLTSLTHLKEKCQLITDKSKQKNEARCVNQTSMEEGDVELF